MIEKRGIQARVINMSSIKPIDEELIVKAAEEIGKIVTVENHNIIGELGSAVAEVTSEKFPVKLKRIGVRDVFGKSGTNEEMKKKFGLRSEDTAKEVLGFMESQKEDESWFQDRGNNRCYLQELKEDDGVALDWDEFLNHLGT